MKPYFIVLRENDSDRIMCKSDSYQECIDFLKDWQDSDDSYVIYRIVPEFIERISYIEEN